MGDPCSKCFNDGFMLIRFVILIFLSTCISAFIANPL